MIEIVELLTSTLKDLGMSNNIELVFTNNLHCAIIYLPNNIYPLYVSFRPAEQRISRSKLMRRKEGFSLHNDVQRLVCGGR